MSPAVLNDEVFVISLCTIWNVIGGGLALALRLFLPAFFRSGGTTVW